jgi:hypothetical protein
VTITTTTTHDLVFKVEAFWDEEGGMGTDSYGGPVKELSDAVHLLELARASQPKMDWIITIEVKTKVT